jgi:hypothetical protein
MRAGEDWRTGRFEHVATRYTAVQFLIYKGKVRPRTGPEGPEGR